MAQVDRLRCVIVDFASITGFFGGPGSAGVGGPVVISKLYNGKDHFFFMFSYEGLRERKSLTQVASVPLTEHRTGNFGSLPIFDPASRSFEERGQISAAEEFPNNSIPANHIHRVSNRILDVIPVGNAGISGQTARFVNRESRSHTGARDLS